MVTATHGIAPRTQGAWRKFKAGLGPYPPSPDRTAPQSAPYPPRLGDLSSYISPQAKAIRTRF